MINDRELLCVVDVYENVSVEIFRPHRTRTHRPIAPRDTNSIPKDQGHGYLKSIDKKTGVYERLNYRVKFSEDPGGPLDNQHFFISLSKALHTEEVFKGRSIAFDNFVGFDYIQGLRGKFLGEHNEKHEVTLDNAESSVDNQAYILHVKGQMYDRDMGGRDVQRPFVIGLTLNTPLYPGDLLGGLVNSQFLRERIDVAVRQVINTQLPSIDIIETIEFTQVGRQIALMVYSNNEYWRQHGAAFSYFSDRHDVRVYASPDFLR